MEQYVLYSASFLFDEMKLHPPSAANKSWLMPP